MSGLYKQLEEVQTNKNLYSKLTMETLESYLDEVQKELDTWIIYDEKSNLYGIRIRDGQSRFWTDEQGARRFDEELTRAAKEYSNHTN